MNQNPMHCKCGEKIYSIQSRVEGICVYCKNPKLTRPINYNLVSNIPPNIKIKYLKEYMSIKLAINIELTENDPESII